MNVPTLRLSYIKNGELKTIILTPGKPYPTVAGTLDFLEQLVEAKPDEAELSFGETWSRIYPSEIQEALAAWKNPTLRNKIKEGMAIIAGLAWMKSAEDEALAEVAADASRVQKRYQQNLPITLTPLMSARIAEAMNNQFVSIKDIARETGLGFVFLHDVLEGNQPIARELLDKLLGRLNLTIGDIQQPFPAPEFDMDPL